MSNLPQPPLQIVPVEKPQHFEKDELPVAFLIEVTEFLWAAQARDAFRVDGTGLTAAVLDTGINAQHVDFAGKVVAQHNFTPDNNNNPEDANDGNGHGTNVGGIVVANGDHTGLAPGATIVPLKVLGNDGSGSFAWVDQALGWVIDHHAEFNISVVSMSLGDPGNYPNDEQFATNTIRQKIQTLRAANIPVLIAAGNDFFPHGSEQGMSFPGIIRECVSVGALYDSEGGGFQYNSGAQAFATHAGQITPFSQRLHPTVNADCYTKIFAPGAPVTSSGIGGEHTHSTQHGTSQAAPVTAGLILLMQEFYKRRTGEINQNDGELPTVDNLIAWLRTGGIPIHDGDNENDNVTHTNLDFIRADALSALDAVRRHFLLPAVG